jgi:fluoroquinolone transport system permease protein
VEPPRDAPRAGPMSTAAAFRSLAAIDARNVARDSMLRWIVLLTPGFGLLFRFAIPQVAGALDRQFGFDLVLYYPLLMSFLPMVAAGMIGTVVGFLLLDQRDDQTMTALLVTPLSLGDYLRYRLAGLMLLSAVFGAVMVPLAGLSDTTPAQIGLAAITAAPLAAIYALFLGTFASNKVQGFALAKAVGVVMIPCIVAYFVKGPWQSAFGLVPHYWALKVFWLFDEGAIGPALVHALIGLVWQALILMLLVRRLARVLRR